MTVPVRLAAARVLLSVGSGRATLAAELDRAREDLPDERDRGLLMELTAGVLRWRAALDALLTQCATRPVFETHETVLTVLRIAAFELRFLTRMPPHAVVHEAVETVRALRQGRAAGFVNAVLRTMTRRKSELTLPARPATDDRDAWTEYLSTTLSHPAWLGGRYLDRAGTEGAERWCEFNNAVPPVSVRIGADTPPAAADDARRALAAAGAAPSALVHDAWRLPPGVMAGLADEVRAALVIQDEGSQLVAASVGAAPGDRVLDVCAAPGGKSAMLSAIVRPGGLVVACDIRPARLRVLTRTLRREEQAPRVVRLDAARALPFGAVFDRVLVDAPCSGLGTISRDPDVKWSRDEASLERFAVLQRQILAQAAAAVRPGGRLTYATCSSEPEENDAVVADFLRQHADFAPTGAPITTRPDRDRVDAYFSAQLVRRESA